MESFGRGEGGGKYACRLIQAVLIIIRYTRTLNNYCGYDTGIRVFFVFSCIKKCIWGVNNYQYNNYDYFITHQQYECQLQWHEIHVQLELRVSRYDLHSQHMKYFLLLHWTTVMKNGTNYHHYHSWGWMSNSLYDHCKLLLEADGHQ